MWSSLLLRLALPALAAANAAFENSAIVRTVDLGGSLVHVTTTYAVKALQPNQKIYSILLGPEENSRTSWLEVTVKGQKKPLTLETIGLDTAGKSNLIAVQLPKALAANGVVNLVVETVQTRATSPWPASAAQAEEQLLKYTTGLFVLSPYHTTVQRTKIKAPTPRIPDFTTPENLEHFTDAATVSKTGATLTYGPYNNITPNTEQHQKTIQVQYAYDRPVLQVTQLKRAAEISHWGSNLNIQDEIHLHNAGPALKGHFSRLAHQQQNFHKRAGPHVLSSLTLHLPAGIRNTYYYDVIGNVSTSRLRTAPSPKAGQSLLNNQYSVLEIKPRYPVMGGWNYSFTLGWDAPLGDSAVYDKATGKYLVKVPIMTLLPGAVVDEAELKIILPEGATEVEVFPPFPAKVNTLSTHVTYLDTTGRPQVTLEYSQLTDKHAGVIYVSYKVPFSAHLKKPFAVGVAFMSVFLIAIAVRRVDLRIHKEKTV